MTQYVINIGTIPNDGTGDPLRTAFNETNLNFDQVFAAGPVLSNVQIANNTILTTTTNGNLILAPNGIGVVQSNVHIVPNTSNIRNLGAADRRWSTVYVQYANVSGGLTVADLTATGNVTVGGNLSVTGNVINIGNIVTDAKTIQLANTANTANAATGSGITVGANDAIATFLFSSSANAWTTNIGLSAVGNVTAPYFFGNGSQLTGLNINTSSISNGTSNVDIPTANANVEINVNAKRWIFDNTGNLTVPVGGALETAPGSAGNILLHPNDGGAVIIQGNVGIGALLTVRSDVANALSRIEIDTFGTGNNSLGGAFVGRFARGNDINTPLAVQNGDRLARFAGRGYDGTGFTDTTGAITIDAVGNWSPTNHATHISFFTTPEASTVTQESARLYASGDYHQIIGNIIVEAGNILPGVSNTYSLGNSSLWWSNIWVAGNTIYIGGVALGMTAGNVLTVGGNAVLQNNSNSTISTTGNITTGNVLTGGIVSATGNVSGNYFIGNGSQLTGISSANTGNVTFNNQAVVGTGDQEGSSGLYLAPGTQSVGNLQYIRVRGGDVATHIHLDTGNNAYFDQYFGDDGKYVKLEAAGNIVINTNDGVGNSAQWTFDTTGNLTLPGNIIAINYLNGNRVIGNVTFSGEAVIGTGTSNTQSGLYLAPDPVSLANSLYLRVRGNILDEPTHIHFDTGNNQYYNQFIGDDNKYVQLANTGNIVINTNNYAGNSAQWNFDYNGVLTLPYGASLKDTSGNSVVFGLNAGANAQGTDSVAIGTNAGNTGQERHNVAIGTEAGMNNQGEDSVAIGWLAGRDDQTRFSIAIGWNAGSNTQGQYAQAYGRDAGAYYQQSGALAMGYGAGRYLQKQEAIAIGSNAGYGSPQSTTVVNMQTSNRVRLNTNTGLYPGMTAVGGSILPTSGITIASLLGGEDVVLSSDPPSPLTASTTLYFYSAQGPGGVAIGSGSAQALQGQNAVAVGYRAGQTRQGNAAVSIGEDAGYTTQGPNAVSIGSAAGNDNQGANAISIGLSAGRTNQGTTSIAIGLTAGQTTQGQAAIAMGFRAGETTQGNSSVALGEEAGLTGQGQNSIAIGRSAGQSSQGDNSVSIGIQAGQTTQGQFAVAIGDNAGNSGQGTDAVAIGASAGLTTQGNGAVAIGISAGQTSQGINSIAIGQGAGETNQGNNSIILNATGAALDQTTANTFTVAPVRNDVANIAEVVFYNTASKEITYGNVISVAGNITGGNLITAGSGGNITLTGGNITGANVVTANSFVGNGATLSNVATQVTGSWTVPVGNNTQSFTVPINNTYQLWVLGNIPNGIIVYNATVSVSNTNVPVIGQQFAWNYEGGGNILMFTSIPAQIVGTAGAISNAAPAVANTNVFTFGINNTSGNTVTVNYGYTKIS